MLAASISGRDVDVDVEKAFRTPSAHASQTITMPKKTLKKETLSPTQSFASSATTLTLEDAEVHHLPEKRYSKMIRTIRYKLFSVYYRLNIIVLLANTLVITMLGALHGLSTLEMQTIAIAVTVNVLVATLIRQDVVYNLLFATIGVIPHWIPLRVRRMAAKIYHLGGIHSGAGIAATIWFGFLNVPVFQLWQRNTYKNLSIEMALLAITLILDLLLVSLVVFSHPCFRTHYHNTWECLHRFAGWIAVGLFCVHTILSTDVKQRKESPSVGLATALMINPIFWGLVIIIMLLVLPWLRLRKVPVRHTYLSDHAIRLHFDYTNVALCTAPKFSDSPLKEWHAFAGIPEEDGVGFSILVSDAGDWTKKIIQNPPKELWTKGIPPRGVLHVAPIFKKVVLVATGSGIGPILSLLCARSLNARIIWSTPDPYHTYSTTIVEQVELADPDAIIINTSKSGRPDLVLETYKLYKRCGAEAVFIISNPKVTKKVVYGLESRGVPIFAPIFDS